MKRKCVFIGKKVLTMALVAVMGISALSGCGLSKKTVETGDVSVEEASKETVDILPSKEETKGSEEDNSLFPIVITKHNVVCKSGDIEAATGQYPEFFFPDDLSLKYPKLRDTLERFNESWKEETIKSVAEYGHYKLIDNYAPDAVYASEITVSIIRADERLFTFAESVYDYSGGAHPNHETNFYNLDPVTGNTVPLTDVITAKPGPETSQMFWQRLYDTYPDLVEEFKSYDFGYDFDTGEEIDTFEQKLKEDNFSWAVLPDGLWIYFSPYEVATYATGYLEMNFSDADYPGLVVDAFKVKDAFDADKNVKYVEDTEVAEITPQEPVYDGPSSISNPCWEGFTNWSFSKDNLQYVTLEKIKEDKTDWIDTSVWCEETNIPRKEFPYEDENYRYSPCSPVEYDYMYTELEIYDKASSEKLYDIDLYTLANGPDDEKDKYSAVTQYIRWARLIDGMLYVELSMNGYASEEPDSSYMVGINLESNQVAFRSEPQTANAENFAVVNDCIICGYGFTSEPDYLYILNRYTGECLEKIPVNSAPEHIEVVGDTLYVCCYNTAYEFKIVKK